MVRLIPSKTRDLFRQTTLKLIVSISFTSAYAQTQINIDGNTRYQTIDGWEAVCNSMEVSGIRDTLLPNLPELIDLAVNDVGITRLRYGLMSGMENPVDYFQQTINGVIAYDSFKKHRYSKFNDNADPFVADAGGFQMSGLDDNMKQLILPFRQAIQARGEQFYLNICFVDFANQSSFHHSSDPEEYAEFLSYVWEYIDSVHGIQPDGLEVILEPDNAAIWDKKHLPGCIAATGKRLKALGYEPEFIAPSVLNLRNIPSYIGEIAKQSDALSFLDVICYHRYSGGSDTVAQQQIVDIAQQYGLKTAMLEYDHNGGVNELHYDLKYNNVVAWTKYALAYKSNEPFAYVYVDATQPNGPIYGVGNQTKYLRQYFKYIRPGAIRIEAGTDDPDIDPVAFQNRNGTQAVVIKAAYGDSVEISGLKAGNYGIKYTLGNYDWRVAPKVYDKDLPEQLIANNEKLCLRIPERGVLTVYGIPKSMGINDIHATGTVRLFPNPALNEIRLGFVPDGKGIYQIFDHRGNEVRTDQIRESDPAIQIEDLIPGLYFLRLGNFTGRFVKL
ncbi:MAG: T9SS type A sorting domain-containing protein [Flavobacteriales bacterium]|nr:T9SS type A sorting domain-containing protein [Flavobacteriales bacterium]